MLNNGNTPARAPEVDSAQCSSCDAPPLKPLPSASPYTPHQLALKQTARGALSLLRDIIPSAFLFMLIDKDGIILESCFRQNYYPCNLPIPYNQLEKISADQIAKPFFDGTGRQANFIYSAITHKDKSYSGFLLVAQYTYTDEKLTQIILFRTASILARSLHQYTNNFIQSDILNSYFTHWITIHRDGKIENCNKSLKNKIYPRIRIDEFLSDSTSNEILQNDYGSTIANINIENLNGDYEITFRKLNDCSLKLLLFNRVIQRPENYLSNSENVSDYIRNILKENINKKSNKPILIEAEDGTEKEYVARRLGFPFAIGSFIEVDCSKLSTRECEIFIFGSSTPVITGKLEQANFGTLYLDHIDYLTHRVQERLVHFLQSRKTNKMDDNVEFKLDVQIIATISRPLHMCINNGSLLQILANQFAEPIRIAPLRNRKRDIAFYAGLEQEALSSHIVFGEYVLPFIESYWWPGNIDQLRYVIRTICQTHGSRPYIDQNELQRMFPFWFQVQIINLPQTKKKRDLNERERLLLALEQNHGKVINAARTLKISRANMYIKLKKYGIDPNFYREHKRKNKTTL